MIGARSLRVLAGQSTAELRGLDRGLLRALQEGRMSYLASIRVIVPDNVPIWRLDGTRMGGAANGTWWNWATSNSAVRVLPDNAVGVSDWQQIHVYPGIPLADGGDACGTDWIANTMLRFTSSLVAVTEYEVTVITNIVQHTQLIT